MLLHGWAANHHVFDPLISHLPTSWSIIAPDLPGHGQADFDGTFNPITIADTLAAAIAEPLNLLGWSLGGLIALHLAARHPEKVRTLTITASFAKFAASSDYPAGLKQPALGKMADLFQQDYPKYIEQFFRLQFLYAPEKAPILDTLLPKLMAYGTPAALIQALDAISTADARSSLNQITTPTLLVYGAKDTITPPRMGDYLAQHLPNTEMVVFDRSSHAPFLTEADRFATLLTDFIHQHIQTASS